MSAKKVIVTVAPTSNFHGKEANAALPEQPEEIAASVRECYDAGAALAHLHARDENGVQTNRTDVFRRINEAVRATAPVIVQNSIAPAFGPRIGTAEDGLLALDAGPEMASLDMGVVAMSVPGGEHIIPWTRGFLVRAASAMRERGIKPELEIFNDSHLDNAAFLIEQGLLDPPYSFSFVMGMHRVNHAGVSFSPRRLLAYVEALPLGSVFSTLGVGTAQVPATTLSLILGGGVRVGFEDNIYYRRGELARSNAQLVERVVRSVRDLGLEPATPEEARAMLGLPPVQPPRPAEHAA